MVSPLRRDDGGNEALFVSSDDLIDFEKKNFDQLSTLRKFYDCLDINGDGMISTEEFQEALQAAMNRVLEDRRLNADEDDTLVNENDDDEEAKTQFRAFWSRLHRDGEVEEVSWKDVVQFCMEQPESLPNLLKPMSAVTGDSVEQSVLETMGMRSLLDDVLLLMDDLLNGVSVSSKRVERMRDELLTSNPSDIAQPRMHNLDKYLSTTTRYGEDVSDFVLGWQGGALNSVVEENDGGGPEDGHSQPRHKPRVGMKAAVLQVKMILRLKGLMNTEKDRGPFNPRFNPMGGVPLLQDEPYELSAAVCQILPAAVLSGSGAPRLAQVLGEASAGWLMDAWELQDLTAGQPLATMVVHLLDYHGLVEYFGLDVRKIHRYFREVEEATPNNPYHNRTHLADVTQALCTLINLGGLGKYFEDPVNLLAAIFAAAIHDYGHPGATQDYLVKTSHKLALRYNDRTVLENMHLAGAFKMLNDKPELNWLKGKLNPEKMAQMRNLMIEMVLATDMKLHFDHVNQLQRLAKRELENKAVSRRVSQAPGAQQGSAPTTPGTPGTPASPSGTALPPTGSLPPPPRTSAAAGPAARRPGRRSSVGLITNSKMTALQPAPAVRHAMAEMDPAKLMVLVSRLGIKCADLMHTTRAWDVHMQWSRANEEESWRVGDKFKELGHKVVPMMDREADLALPKAQIGFFDVIVTPMFRSWTKLFPSSNPVLQRLEENYRVWDKQLKESAPAPLPPPRRSRASIVGGVGSKPS